MNAIAAVSAEWGIGQDNCLLFHISEDLKRFRSLTLGGTVIMGRKTLESLPGQKPLPKRRNIILSRNPQFTRDGIETARSIEEVLRLTADTDPDKIWVCGGGEIYAALLPYCAFCYITRVAAAPPCDTFFPNLDKLPGWEIFHTVSDGSDGDLTYEFIDYRNRSLRT